MDIGDSQGGHIKDSPRGNRWNDNVCRFAKTIDKRADQQGIR